MPWLQVRLAITPEQAETYEDALLEVGAVSVTFMDAEDQPIFEPDLGTTPLWSHTHLLALFEADTEAAAVFAHLQLLTGTELPEHHTEVIADQDWERSWMDGFEPMRFGRRLWIVPSWHAAPEPDAVNLLLDPGLAFGTGTHPTTALCLEWLDGQDLHDCSVLDFGCGSGILAIAALLLGAPQAVGTDIDPQALEASRDNAGRNGIAGALPGLSAGRPAAAPRRRGGRQYPRRPAGGTGAADHFAGEARRESGLGGDPRRTGGGSPRGVQRGVHARSDRGKRRLGAHQWHPSRVAAVFPGTCVRLAALPDRRRRTLA